MLKNVQQFFSKYLLKKKNKSMLSDFEAQIMSENPAITPEKLVFQRMEYPQLNRFFSRFFNSKPIDGKVNGKSLAFVIGAQDVGKTQYIQKNIASVISRKNRLKNNLIKNQNILFQIHKSPQFFEQQIQEKVFDNQHHIIAYFNFKKIGGYNYQSFINVLHSKLKQLILQKVIQFQSRNQSQEKLRNKQKTNLLTAQILKQIVLHQYASQFIFIYTKDVIYSILQDKDPIYFSKEAKEKLQQFNQSILGKSWQFFFNQKYKELIEIISLQTSKSQVWASMNFFYSVFQRIQYQNRPQQYIDSWYQNGIETSNYLFAILDFLSGFGGYCEKIQKDYIHADKQTKKQILQKINSSDNYILKGNHIDVLLCFSNLQNLYCNQIKDSQFLTFLDHIVCRNSRETNIRKHFPVLIQLPNRVMLDDFIQLGKLDVNSPVIVQILGYRYFQLKFSNLIQIFTLQFAKKIFFKLGANPTTWDRAIAEIAKGQKLKNITQGRAKYQQRQHLKLQARINRIFTYQDCLPQINKGTLKYDISDVLWALNKTKGLMMAFRPYYSIVLFNTPHFKAFMEQNILFHSFYHPNIELTTLTNVKILKKLRYKLGKIPIHFRIYKMIMHPWIMKSDIKYNLQFQKDANMMQRHFKYNIDAELYVTYYGPQTAYDFVYPRTAYTTQFTSLP